MLVHLPFQQFLLITTLIYAELVEQRSIFLSLLREESVGNDDVSIVCARK